ncbi:MAG: uncharacterized membrane-anchored protein YhcB (DUF1043 family) [Pseudomonadales bacterium]|jgi:uncharacterized membrane-anchored protein YhcB (DUF1043 family)
MELLLSSTLSLAVGIVIGIIGTRLLSANGKKTAKMEKHLTDTENKMNAYKQEVSQHFEKTAKLIDELNESYRNVHNHLADAAHSLSDAPYNSTSIKTIPAKEQIEGITKQKITTDTVAPLDYAPKTSPLEPGMLDESFGIKGDKKTVNDELIPRVI